VISPGALIVWVDGALVEEHRARISPFDHGLLTGDGIFETLRIYRGQPFSWRRHYERLARSAQGMTLAIPPSEALRRAALDVIEANRLSEARLRITVTGGPSPLEQTHIGDIKSKVRHRVIDLSGRTDLLTLAALIARACLLITVDSAPMHLASASRTPQVILFGPTNPFHWRPRESPALILQGTSTAPFTEFVPKQPRLPMNQVSTQAVIDAMETLLSARAMSPRL
jgi:ADP-heptose:LPS heptosyltransferase